jgi:hypothetical protein
VVDRVGTGVNTDELFSAQAIGDHKCFLRLRIDPDGTLTVYPIKIERAARWAFVPPAAADSDRRWFRPVDGEPVAELIEEPVVVRRRPDPRTDDLTARRPAQSADPGCSLRSGDI